MNSLGNAPSAITGRPVGFATHPPAPCSNYSPEQVHAMLEIKMAIVPPLNTQTFNSFMPALALAASSLSSDERKALLEPTLKLFGEPPGSVRAAKLENAIRALPPMKHDGGNWSWADFSDQLKDPLDGKNVYCP